MGGGYRGTAAFKGAAFNALQAARSGACIKAILAEGQDGNAERGLTKKWRLSQSDPEADNGHVPVPAYSI